MNMAAVQSAWAKWGDRSATGALVFCDWCQDHGVSDYWTANWRAWVKMRGGENPGDWLTHELARLVKAEWHASAKSRKAFGPRLKALREKAGLSGESLAAAAGMTRQAVHNYEAGQRSPTWDAVQQLAAALGVSTDTFRGPG